MQIIKIVVSDDTCKKLDKLADKRYNKHDQLQRSLIVKNIINDVYDMVYAYGQDR